MSEKIETLVVKKPASFTIEGVKEPISIKFDFGGMTISEIADIAAKDLVTDIQNNVRPNAADSDEKKKAKIAKMREIVKESREKGHFEIKVSERARRLSIVTISPETVIATASDEELERLQALIEARLGKK